MAYCFGSNTSIQDEVHRIVSEEVAFAVRALTKFRSLKQRDKAIHEARKSLKKLRGLVKLLGPTLRENYKVENRALRNAGRSLSELRDARAIIETFVTLTEKEPAHWEERVVTAIRTALQNRKRVRDRELKAPQTMQRAAEALAQFGERALHWRIEKDGLDALEPGLLEIYRAAGEPCVQPFGQVMPTCTTTGGSARKIIGPTSGC